MSAPRLAPSEDLGGPREAASRSRYWRVEQLAELLAVVRRGIGDREAAGEAVPAVDREMVLVTEHRHHDRVGNPCLGSAFACRALAPALEDPAAGG